MKLQTEQCVECVCVCALRLTDPEVNVIEEEAAQHLVQGPVHLQPCRSSHQPLQQLLQLFGHMLQKNETVDHQQLVQLSADSVLTNFL